MDMTQEKCFKVYEDDEVGLDALILLQKNSEQENIIDSHADDDVETDEEVFSSGCQMCYKDLIYLKKVLKLP
jgi:hypothetical protein